VDVGDAAATSGSPTLPAIGETQPESATAARTATKQRIFKEILANTIHNIKHILPKAQKPILRGTVIDFAHKRVRRVLLVREVCCRPPLARRILHLGTILKVSD
jgi:hypothetical protein